MLTSIKHTATNAIKSSYNYVTSLFSSRPARPLQVIQNRIDYLVENLNSDNGYGRMERRAIQGGVIVGGGLGLGVGLGLKGLAIFASAPAAMILGPIGLIGLAGAGAVGCAYKAKKSLDNRKVLNHASTLSEIRGEYSKYLNAQIEQILIAPAGNEIQFIFNPTLCSLSEIQPQTMSKEIFKSILTAFNKRKYNTQKPTITTIDFSNANLNDDQLRDLLTAGLGVFGTRTLVLDNNALTLAGIQMLERAIIEKRTSFQNLRSISLQRNNLSGSCLQSIINIVEHLELEELNLSNNPLNTENIIAQGVDSIQTCNLEQFFNEYSTRMPSLKRLSLLKVGLGAGVEPKDLAKISERHVTALTRTLKEANLMERLDITKNKRLRFAQIEDEVIPKGLNNNISITEFLTDYNDPLGIAEKFRLRNQAVNSIITQETPSQSRLLSLLNYKIQHGRFPGDLETLLSRKLQIRIDEIIESVQESRNRVLDVNKNQKIRMTEKEFIKQRKGTLDEFYNDILNNKNRSLVEPTLISSITKTPLLNPTAAKTLKVDPAITLKTENTESDGLTLLIVPEIDNNASQLKPPVVTAFDSARRGRNKTKNSTTPRSNSRRTSRKVG